MCEGSYLRKEKISLHDPPFFEATVIRILFAASFPRREVGGNFDVSYTGTGEISIPTRLWRFASLAGNGFERKRLGFPAMHSDTNT